MNELWFQWDDYCSPLISKTRWVVFREWLKVTYTVVGGNQRMVVFEVLIDQRI